MRGLRLPAMDVNPLSPAWSSLVWLPIIVTAFAWPAVLVAMLAGALVLALFWACRTLASLEERLSDPAASPP